MVFQTSSKPSHRDDRCKFEPSERDASRSVTARRTGVAAAAGGRLAAQGDGHLARRGRCRCAARPRARMGHVQRGSTKQRLSRVWQIFSLAAAATCLGMAASMSSVSSLYAASVLDPVTAAQVIMKIAPRLGDASGWADDILSGFKASGIEASHDRFCSVTAIIQQESGFNANPEEPRLGEKAFKAANEKIANSSTFTNYFRAFPRDKEELLSRIKAAKTERDLDLAHRWLADKIINRWDGWGLTFLIGIAGHGMSPAEYFEANNNIHTIGSMSVKVSFVIKARRTEEHDTRDLTLEEVYQTRDLLYTRQGGIHYGIKRLLQYYAGYDSKVYLFADYNSGRYSSRNAAVQLMVSTLTGKHLDLDGDLLAYEGETAVQTPGESESQINDVLFGQIDAKEIRADLLREKSYAFRETRTYQEIRKLYETRTHKPAPYAIIPQIELHSAHIDNRRRFTTADFARSVERHYLECENVFAKLGRSAQNNKAPDILPLPRPAPPRSPDGPPLPKPANVGVKDQRQLVMYSGQEQPGTIVIDTAQRFLYLVQESSRALRYRVAVGKPGFTWAGTRVITVKREWPDWYPPPEMRVRQPELPGRMPGGPNNPLGARALYIGSTLYRIHGTNEPGSIGYPVSSGCFRMRNEDVIDLYERVKVGTKVVVN